MSPRDAARAFVADLIARHLSEVDHLVDGFQSTDSMDRARAALYGQLEATIREQWAFREHDFDVLHGGLLALVPFEGRSGVAALLAAIAAAHAEIQLVQRQAGYLIGIELVVQMLGRER